MVTERKEKCEGLREVNEGQEQPLF